MVKIYIFRRLSLDGLFYICRRGGMVDAALIARLKICPWGLRTGSNPVAGTIGSVYAHTEDRRKLMTKFSD